MPDICKELGIDPDIFEGDVQFICSDCKQPCTPVGIDRGIGPFEFWGAKGFDSQPDVGSDCCEAMVLTYGCCEYTLDDYNRDHYDDRADYEYDRRRDEEMMRQWEEENKDD